MFSPTVKVFKSVKQTKFLVMSPSSKSCTVIPDLSSIFSPSVITIVFNPDIVGTWFVTVTFLTNSVLFPSLSSTVYVNL